MSVSMKDALAFWRKNEKENEKEMKKETLRGGGGGGDGDVAGGLAALVPCSGGVSSGDGEGDGDGDGEGSRGTLAADTYMDTNMDSFWSLMSSTDAIISRIGVAEDIAVVGDESELFENISRSSDPWCEVGNGKGVTSSTVKGIESECQTDIESELFENISHGSDHMCEAGNDKGVASRTVKGIESECQTDVATTANPFENISRGSGLECEIEYGKGDTSPTVKSIDIECQTDIATSTAAGMEQELGIICQTDFAIESPGVEVSPIEAVHKPFENISRGDDWQPEDDSDYGDMVTCDYIREIAYDLTQSIYGDRFPPCWEMDDAYDFCVEIALDGVSDIESEEVWGGWSLFHDKMQAAVMNREHEISLKFRDVALRNKTSFVDAAVQTREKARGNKKKVSFESTGCSS